MVRTKIIGWLVAVAWCAPALAQNCTPFTDVPASSAFCADVQWIYNRGITLGCTATTYCPAGNVTRLQMAAFLHRLGNVTFQHGGNAFGATATLGTTDASQLEIVLGTKKVVRLERRDSAGWGSDMVNVVMGHPENRVARVCPNPVLCLGSDSPTGGAVLGGGAHGTENRVTDDFGVVAGGLNNRAGNSDLDSSNSPGATVGGGQHNDATAEFATVGGGAANSATGPRATVPGGLSNVAGGNVSFAAGMRAHALADGCFVWADATSLNPFTCTTPHAFMARAAGGFHFRSNSAASAGVDLFAGASAWSPFSDRALKENVVAVDATDVLERLLRVPIATWNYLSQDRAIRHIGPMAQDVHAAFGLGESDKHISTIDADGIALAAIQGLNAKLEALLHEKDARIAALERRLSALDTLTAELAALRAMLAAPTRDHRAMALW